MAGSLAISVAATLTNPSGATSAPVDKTTWQHSPLALTQTGQGQNAGIVSVGTSEEDLATVDITTLGWLFLKNLDTTNYVTWGPKSAGSMVGFGKIKAGEEATLRLLPGITIRWQANTAAVKIKYLLTED